MPNLQPQDDVNQKECTTDRARSLRWGVYALLIAIAVGNMSGRLLAVNSVNLARLESYRVRARMEQERTAQAEKGLTGAELEQAVAKREEEFKRKLRLQRPFLSANDRSRWLTIRALVEQGTYQIDAILTEPTWDSIDMVQHPGRDGQPHLYSSKPPLLPTLLAGEYWLINRITGATLGTHPYAIGRFMLFTTNVAPLVLMYIILAHLVERFGTTDWGRIFVMSAATLGTYLSTFAIVLNNHIVAAVSASIALYALARILDGGERKPWLFMLAGLAATFAAANELPALALVVLMGLLLWRHAAKETWTYYVPAGLVVAVAFFGTNYLAHNTLSPPYAHRSQTDPNDNWYVYTYELNGRQRTSYWTDRKGIDLGEPSRAVYAWHVLAGHHGVLSLTPVWALSVLGAWYWLREGNTPHRELSLLVVSLTMVCLTFYIGFREQGDRNYGGVTSGFRWMFWFTPLWLVIMLPAVDRWAASRLGKALMLTLLAISVCSAAFPTWNPWTQPWIYQWMQYCGWQGFS